MSSNCDSRGDGTKLQPSASLKSSSAPSPTRDSKAQGSIKLVISELSDLDDDERMETSFHTIGNLPWKLLARTLYDKEANNVKYLGVFVYCNPDMESLFWSCEASMEFRLHNQQEVGKLFSKQLDHKFHYNSNNQGFLSFIKWTEISDPNKGYIKNDSVTLEAHISVKETRGIRLSPSFDFTTPHPNCSDGILVIDNVRLHISKTYLALFSPVFSTLFYGEFKERNSEEIPLQDIVLEEFVELLHVIYPSHKSVSAQNVEFLLKLGDRYEVQFVMNKCEKFLTKTNDIPFIKKFAWADQYRLAKLQDVCIKSFKSAADIKNQIKSTKEYETLGETTKEALLEKMFKLT